MIKMIMMNKHIVTRIIKYRKILACFLMDICNRYKGMYSESKNSTRSESWLFSLVFKEDGEGICKASLDRGNG